MKENQNTYHVLVMIMIFLINNSHSHDNVKSRIGARAVVVLCGPSLLLSLSFCLSSVLNLLDGCSKLLHGKTTILREKLFVFRGPIADFRGAYFTPVLVTVQTVLAQNFAKT